MSNTGEHRHKSHHELPLKLIKSPLIVEREEDGVRMIGQSSSDVALSDMKQMRMSESHISDGSHSHPVFKRHAESTPSELFYDLFFVANLTTFTNAHEINDHQSLVSYVGFFVILWFTWLQVTLFDLRMSRDSLFDRLCKAIQFGIMVGFVVVGSQYTPEENIVDGKTMSLLLMGSRLTLALQYGTSLFFLRDYPSSRIPLAIVTAVTFLSAMFYLGISFDFTTFGESKSSYAYVAWYIVSFAETLINIGVSSYWRQLSFKGTHIVERMSLLTLIILGEGIIGLCERVQIVASAQSFTYGVTSNFAGVIIAALLLIYFLYMLYFDTLPEEHFGTIRQQFWAFLHFPLHVALVLFLEGSSSFVIWSKGMMAFSAIGDQLSKNELISEAMASDFQSPPSQNSTEFFETAARQTNATINAFFSDWGTFSGSEDVSSEVYSSISEIAEGATSSARTVYEAILKIEIKLIEVICSSYKIETPEEESETSAGADDSLVAAFESLMNFLKLYDLVLLYFFICGGCALLLLGLLYTLNNRKWSGKFDWVRMGAFFVVGTILTLLSTMEIGARRATGIGYDLLVSAWVIPTAMICLFVVVAIFHLPVRW